MSIPKHDIIKGALRLKGTSLSIVARELNVRPTTVTVVSKGYRRSMRIEMALAEALGMTHEELWPERNVRADDKALADFHAAVERVPQAQRKVAKGGRMAVG